MNFKDFCSSVLTEVIKKRGDEWVVLTHDESRVLGTHKTEKEAIDQLQAIEISKHKK